MPHTAQASGGNLLAETSSFVGRRWEIAEVKRLLGESRLVTLTGVGGTGKTRLAVRAARGVRRAFPDGTWFVDLTEPRTPDPFVGALNGPDGLAYLVLLAVGMRDQPGGVALTDQLVEQLREWRALLVLDNCGHLMPACANLADALLRGCPSLRMLATSRQPLFVAGELLFDVPPLPTPEPGTPVSVAAVQQCDSVALFVARARAAAPDFALTEANAAAVAELCRRLDGLPLAIELAAAQVRTLAPEQILARMSGEFALPSTHDSTAPARQQTLRACGDWSFESCGQAERLLWARSSVFAGGFELDAAEGVCADETLPVEELLEVVAGLVDKSILIRDDRHSATARYLMLETLRDYGREKLIEMGEQEQLLRRHRDWCVQLARRAEADMISSRQPEWLARLDRELPNLRAAMEYSLTAPARADSAGSAPAGVGLAGADSAAIEAALAIPGSLYLYWMVYGLHREGREWSDRALACSSGPTTARLKALLCSAALAILQGDLAAAGARIRQGDELAAQRGDSLGYAFAHHIRGVAAPERDPAAGVREFECAVRGFAAEPGDDYLHWRVNALAALGLARVMNGDAAGAAADYEAILAICQPRGETWYAGFALYILGLGSWRRDPTAAASRLREGLRCMRKVNDTLGTAWCLDTLAWIAGGHGQPERAATLLGVTTRLAGIMGARPALIPELAAHHEEYELRVRGALGDKAYLSAFARGEGLPLDEAVAYALDEPVAYAPDEPRPYRVPRPRAASRPAAAATPLTRREQQVAELIAQGMTNKDIAARLVVSQRTAESHVERILGKLAVGSRAQVAAWVRARDADWVG